MTKEIFLSGMTADQLSEMIRESLRDELRQLHPEPSAVEAALHRIVPIKSR